MFTEKTLRACVVLKQFQNFDWPIFRFSACAKFNAALGAHQMEPASPLISRVNLIPGRFINRTIFFCNPLESHECACCLPSDVRQYHCHFSIFIGSFLYQRAKPPQGTVLFINLPGKGLTPRACVGN